MSPVMTSQDQPSNVFVYSHHLPPPPQSQMVSTMPSMTTASVGRHHNMNSESHVNSKLMMDQQQHMEDSEGLILPTSNPTSPPHHIRNMLLSQGQGVAKREVITGGNPAMVHSHGIPLQHAGEGVSSGVGHASSGGLVNITLHGQQGLISPTTSAPSNPHSIQSQPGGFNWSYTQPMLLSDGYSHHILPTMQASSSQPQGYFKPF